MDVSHFFSNPVGNAVSSYTGVMGVWFYAVIMVVVGGYVLMKTESWAAASGIFILGAIVFSALLPPYVIFLWAIAAACSFAAILVDVFVLK